MEGDDTTPKYRLEHATSDKATCQRAACKRSGTKIAKGALRLGIYQWFERDSKYITLWREWGCVTPFQIKAMKALAEGDPEKAPGYLGLSPESQEQVRLAFKDERVPDKEFQDIRTDLVKKGSGGRSGEIANVMGYKVDVASRAAMCRGTACKEQGIKILKGELRLGLVTPFDGEHTSMLFKHWKCATALDLNGVKQEYYEAILDGLDELPQEYQTVVMDSIKQDKIVEPPVLEAAKPAAKKRKPQKKQQDVDDGEASSPPGKKRGADDLDAPDDEIILAPKKRVRRASAKSIDASDSEWDVVANRETGPPTLGDDTSTDDFEAAPKKKGRAKKANASDDDFKVAPKKKRAPRAKKAGAGD